MSTGEGCWWNCLVTRVWTRSLRLDLLQTTPSRSFYQEPSRGDTLNSRAERVPAGRAGEEDRAPWLGMKGSGRTKEEEEEATKMRWENKLTSLFKEPQTLSAEH